MKEPAARRRSAESGEPRWHASAGVLIALALYITLPPKLTIGPAWIAPLLVLAVLVPLSIAAPHRHAETRRMRGWSIGLIAIVNFFNVASVLLLINGFFHPAKVVHLSSAAVLLRNGAQIWITNVLVFALWFWELDGDGPEARAHAGPAGELARADFLYPLERHGRRVTGRQRAPANGVDAARRNCGARRIVRPQESR